MNVLKNLYVKAVQSDTGEWMLEVLGIPYGGPFDGKDSDGEYFTANTKLWLDEIPQRPIVYYHGMKEQYPQIIGREVGHERRDDGVWFRIILDQTNAFAQRIWQAALNGLARASSGAISHLTRIAGDGEILQWPVGEMSLMDSGAGESPANPYAVAIPLLKASFKLAGLDIPDILEEHESDGTPQEVNEEGATRDSSETVNPNASKTVKAQLQARGRLLLLENNDDTARAPQRPKGKD